MGKGKVIAGFVLGIIGLLMGFGFLISILALPVSVIGLILSVSGGKQLRGAGVRSGMATASLVISIIATSFSAITFFTCGICILWTAARAADIAFTDWESLLELFEYSI